MDEARLFPTLLHGALGVAVLVFLLLFFISAPYGRHAREHWGPTIPSTLGWVVMEAPSSLLFGWLYLQGDRKTLVASILVLLWELHYVNRTFIYPFRRRGGAPTMPLVVALMGFTFNTFNAYLNGRWLFFFGPAEVTEDAWLRDPRFLAGVLIFLAGFAINQHADQVLRDLRKPGESGYKIPQGGLYRLVSCPNYLGEILEWTGFALASWSPAGACFAIWTFANLVPRARTNHRWYRDRFADYPKERRAVIPWLF